MTEYIVNTYWRLEVGKIYPDGLFTHTDDTDKKKVAIKILEEVTEIDYRNFCRQMNVEHLIKNLDNCIFYRIEVLD